MEKKLVLLEQRLKEYGHVPSQKEDRPLYANTKYYNTNYPFHPIVGFELGVFWGGAGVGDLECDGDEGVTPGLYSKSRSKGVTTKSSVISILCSEK